MKGWGMHLGKKLGSAEGILTAKIKHLYFFIFSPQVKNSTFLVLSPQKVSLLVFLNFILVGAHISAINKAFSAGYFQFVYTWVSNKFTPAVSHISVNSLCGNHIL